MPRPRYIPDPAKRMPPERKLLHQVAYIEAMYPGDVAKAIDACIAAHLMGYRTRERYKLAQQRDTLIIQRKVKVLPCV